MFRLISLFLILVGAMYANGSCSCPPSFIVVVNGFTYSSHFTATAIDSRTYNINTTINQSTAPDPEQGPYTGGNFEFTLRATTHPDPDIDMDTSISGDPTVGIRITQTFLGGPLLNLTTDSFGILTDLDHNGHASVIGSPFIQTTTVGSTVVQQNTGCDFDVETSVCAPSHTSQTILVSRSSPYLPYSGVMVLDIGFQLSDNDKFSLHSNVTLTPVPEPAAAIPVAAGLLAMAGISWRRKRNRLDVLG